MNNRGECGHKTPRRHHVHYKVSLQKLQISTQYALIASGSAGCSEHTLHSGQLSSWPGRPAGTVMTLLNRLTNKTFETV